MFDEVFGGINFGDLLEKSYCPCGCTCLCYENEAERVANTNARVATVKASDLKTDPSPA